MEYLQIYRKMLLIRRFELRVAELHRAGEVPGFTHLYWGQEAIAVGVCHWLSADDYVVSTHRGHGHCLAQGAEPGRVLAEVMGREAGDWRGRGGAMHVADFSCGMLGANGIVGGSLPISTGAALACKLAGEGNMAVAFFGDGAVEEGVFHESLNLASLWSLPLLFVCENNEWAISVPVSKRQGGRGAAALAEAHGIGAREVDGNDAVAVVEAAGEMVERVRRGRPGLLNCQTIRWGGHHSAQPTRAYRTEEDCANAEAACPIARFGKRLLAEGEATEQQLEAMSAEVESEIDAAQRFAQSSPLPRAETVTDYVYYEGRAD